MLLARKKTSGMLRSRTFATGTAGNDFLIDGVDDEIVVNVNRVDDTVMAATVSCCGTV